ncbi:hypothetical protein [Tritonibacter scottomollicae]|uniref:Uncharacterized protein n=1 Tax=Tritonibacter scottomollicae TaxID=483013 RepID=A0A2T1AAK3_TRISK|nr:hypothetical protein [Tritonibacter scottomollicae]PRZ45612.1 hypothetical protein CLV89_11463 [Tritonibacter scottomollicae]
MSKIRQGNKLKRLETFARRNTESVSPKVLSLVRRFSKERRNDVRGAISKYKQNGLTSKIEQNIRANQNAADMAVAAELLESPFGLKNRKPKDLKQEETWVTYENPTHKIELEIAYACGFLNSWKTLSHKAIGTIKFLSTISNVSTEDACGAVKACAKEWGASRYLSYKIAYLKSNAKNETYLQRDLAEADEILGHKEYPGIQYSALENIEDKISIFSVARRHTNTLRRSVGANFRRSQSLNNIVFTPVSNDDAAAFLHRAVEISLIDTVHALWILMNLRDRFPYAQEKIQNHLHTDIFTAFRDAQLQVSQLHQPKLTEDINEGTDLSLRIYRYSAAFLEFENLCKFRNDIDRVVGYRLVASLHRGIDTWHANSFDNIAIMRRTNSDFRLDLHDHENVRVDTFYRTYLFLRFIQQPANLSFIEEKDVKFIFDNTIGLDSLLLERELQSLHLNASESTRPLISVLALALYRGRSSDPDIDFDYRLKLEQYISANFNSHIPSFIKSLTTESPQIASYLATSLSEATLQKMYSLIQSPEQASEARKEILHCIGFALNRIEYIIEAEAIETRGKVATLRKYFDTSRMFVDSVAMRDWLEANPSAYTQQYKELLPKLVATLAAVADIKNEKTGETTKVPIVQISSTVDHLVKQIAVEAFKEFCINAEFGIESYLGRRIRHNTLHGVMTDPIDGVLSSPMYHPVIAGTRFGYALQGWQSFYRNYIERIRKEYLQFLDESKPNSLFDPVLNFEDSATIRSVSQLSQSLKLSGPEMLPDLIIAFCWKQIGPQLDYASRQIKVKMAGEVKQSLESALLKYNGPEERRVFTELTEEIDAVFTKVASWFRLPETGFVPATINSLCNIIDIEFGREEMPTIVTGNALKTEYTGISVHRIYDCLAVLIQNAIHHGELQGEIRVNSKTEEIPNTNLHRVRLSVSSHIDDEKVEECVNRINNALKSTETGKDMVTEGYSGLKKVKYITKLNEGKHTVELTSVGNEIELRFTLKAEVASERIEDETDFAD